MQPDAQPLVSFVALAYNHAKFVGECLESMLAQKRVCNFEIVVVDDASSDATPEILRRYARADSRIRVIQHATNLGHIQTVTDGLRAARGKFVARIDSDDRYRHDFLDRVLPIFDAFPRVGLVFGDAAIIDAQGTITVARSDRWHAGRDWHGQALVRLLEENLICAPTVIARREAWLSALPVPSGLAFHDWYFTLMIAREHDFYFLNHVLADYRVHPGNLHAHITRDKTEEPSIFRMLGQMYAQSEREERLEASKQRARRRVYGKHYLTMADKYFGMHMTGDARRCYLAALLRRPEYLLVPGTVRRFAATFVSRERYEDSKRLATAASRRFRSPA
jgi:glycosyltransferase involved in cell wall biosynthesis